MKTYSLHFGIRRLCALLFSFGAVHGADFTVNATAFEFEYTINKVSANPTLQLVRGQTYTFQVDACPCHPFQILGAPAGAVLNNNTSSGIITFNVPLAAANYTYSCSIHFFGGAINTIDPPPPLSAIQQWRQTHFGTTENTGDAADLFDFDKDGLVNLVEFAFGLDPKSGSSLLLPAAQLQEGNLVIAFTHPANVEDITYTAEWSATLQGNSWVTVPDTGSPVTHLFTVPAAGAPQFVRLRVTYSKVLKG